MSQDRDIWARVDNVKSAIDHAGLDVHALEQTLKSKKFESVDSLLFSACKYVEPMPKEILENIHPNDLAMFKDVCFTDSRTYRDIAASLKKFILSNPKLHARTLGDIHQKMVNILQEYNQTYNARIPYINWLPAFGGPAQSKIKETDVFDKFIEENGLEYPW